MADKLANKGRRAGGSTAEGASAMVVQRGTEEEDQEEELEEEEAGRQHGGVEGEALDAALRMGVENNWENSDGAIGQVKVKQGKGKAAEKPGSKKGIMPQAKRAKA